MKLLWGALLLTVVSLHAEDAFPPGELDKITVKNLPACPVIEAEIPVSSGDWEKGFRQCARYAALSDSALQMPVLRIYPDWLDPQHPRPAGRQLVQLFLNPAGSFPDPREKGLKVVESPAMTVACFAARGAYTDEKFHQGLDKIQAHLRRMGLPMIGPPRYVLFQTTGWTPKKWWISEVQVPIPSDSSAR